MPYRCMIPRKVNNLLVACRAFSSNAVVNNFFNLIPHCIALGEAAGIAAAKSISSGVNLEKINVRALQASLKKQGTIVRSDNPHHSSRYGTIRIPFCCRPLSDMKRIAAMKKCNACTRVCPSGALQILTRITKLAAQRRGEFSPAFQGRGYAKYQYPSRSATGEMRLSQNSRNL